MEAFETFTGEEPDWVGGSLFADEIRALGPAGRKCILELDRGCSNLSELLLLALPTAAMADRLALLNEALKRQGLSTNGRPNKLLAEIVRIEKMFLMNLRSLGFCDKPPEKQKTMFP